MGSDFKISAVGGFNFHTVGLDKKERKEQYASLDKLMKSETFTQKYWGLFDGKKKVYYHDEIVVSAQPYETKVKQGDQQIACSGLEIRVSDDLSYPRRMNHTSEIPRIGERIFNAVVKPSYANENNDKPRMRVIQVVKKLNPTFK